jgi:hypothetical protein
MIHNNRHNIVITMTATLLLFLLISTRGFMPSLVRRQTPVNRASFLHPTTVLLPSSSSSSCLFLSSTNENNNDNATTPEDSLQQDAPEDSLQQDAFDAVKNMLQKGVTSLAVATNGTLVQLLALAAATGRGEFATLHQKQQVGTLLQALEATNPTPEPVLSPAILGTWQLLYSDTQLFRSSPFFLAARAVCQTQSQAQQFEWFCRLHRQALAISNIQTVQQIVTPTTLYHEFQVSAGAIPFLSAKKFQYSGGLPVTVDGVIVSSADCTPTNAGYAWELWMDTVQIKGSNLPGLRTVLDQLKLQSRYLSSLLENLPSYSTPKPIFETTYLSQDIRISRDQDGHAFVYRKVSNDTEPTDYSNTMADFGLGSLLEGFNDAVTKVYL